MADIKNFGIKGLAADVQMGKSGGRLKYDSANNRFDLTQSNGSTLEDIRFGSVVAGTWTGSAVGTQYGGTGQDLSSATGLLQFTNGVASATTVDLGNVSFVSGILSVSNGGTGANNDSDARTNLGLGSIATQDDNSVSLTGGSIDGVTIGGSTAAAGSFTTLSANGGITGDLTGDVTGTADFADALSSSVTVSISSDATGSATFSAAGDNANIALTLATVNSDVGSYGDASSIPVITVDAKGRITAVSTQSISTSFSIAGDNGSNDTVNGGETLSVVGASGQIETTITDNQIEIGIVDGASIANLTVTGTFTSDDITSSQVTVQGDAVITGNLTVQGTQTIVESTTVSTGDAVVRVNSDGAAVSAGLEANINGTMESVLYVPTSSRWELSGDVYTAGDVEAATFTGDLTGDVTGDVTGTVSDISNHDTDALTEGSTNRYYTTDRANSAMDAYLVGGTGLTYTSGTIDLDSTAVTAGTYGSATEIPTFTVDAQGRLTAASNVSISTYWTLAGDSGTSQIDGADTATVAGGTNITTSVSGDTVTVDLDSDISLTSVTASGAVTGGSLTDGTATLSGGDLTGAVDITASGTVTGGTLTDGTLSSTAGTITGGVAATFSGAVTGGSLTDGTATLSSGALSGATTGSFSGNVSAANFSTAGTVEAGNADVTGTLAFGSLSDGSITIVGFADEDNMASDSDQLIPTQQSVKAYVDSQLGSSALDIAGDSGSDSVDLDSQTLTISGGTGLSSSVSGQTVTIDLDNTAVSAASYGAAGSVATFTVDAQGRLTAASDVTIDITASQVNDFNSAVDTEIDNYLVGGVGIDYSFGTIDLADTTVVAASYGAAGSVATFTVDAQGRLTAASDTTIDITASQVSDFTTAAETAIDGYVTGGVGLTYSAGTIDLDDTAVTAGTYGSATNIPQFTVDAQGRITSASNIAVATNFSIAGDNGSNDTVNGGETLTVVGTANQIETTITNNSIEIGIVDGASIANLSVTGTFTSDDITSASISIDGDAIITGNLTIQGTQTIVESTTVQTADAIFRTNSNGANTDAGFEANTANGVKQILYTAVGQEWDFGSENVKAATFEGDLTGDVTGDVTGTVSDISNHDTDALAEGVANLYYTDARVATKIDSYVTGGTGVDITSGTVSIGQSVGTTDNVTFNQVTADLVGNADTATALESAQNFSASGDATASAVSFDGTGAVDLALTLATVNTDVGTYGNATSIPSITVNAKGLITGVTTNAVATELSIGGDSGDDTVDLLSDQLVFSGGNNISTTVTNNDVSIALNDDVTLSGNLSAVDGTFSGAVEATSFSDGTTSISAFVTEAGGLAGSDNDTSVPTTAAVIDYVANNAGDGMLLRGTFTADSTESSFEVGTVPNVSSRTYYADKIVIKVGTAFSGGSFNHILVKDNAGSGATLVAADDADAATAGTYVIELDGDQTLTKNQTVTVKFLQSDGATVSVPTAGSMTATVHYKYV